jgi:hypothetical protein
MSRDEAFSALSAVLTAFINSTDAMKATTTSPTLTHSLMPCQWTKSPELEASIKSFQTQSDGLAGSCTKLSLVDLASMPDAGLQSLFDEILKISHGLIATVMTLFSMSLSRPLFDEVHRLAKAELTQVLQLVGDIQTQKFDTCKAAIGQVWEMNELIQKLPLTNKVAYKRALMAVGSVVKDTHREFKEARDESIELNRKKTLNDGEVDNQDEEEGIDSCMDEDWGVMNEDGDDDGFTPEEMPYVDAALSIMEKSFTTVKVSMEMMTIMSEQSTPSTVFSVDKDGSFSGMQAIQEWVATVFILNKKFSTSVTDLGMELYAPLCLDTLKAQYDIAYDSITQVSSKFLEAHKMCKEMNYLSAESEERLQRLLNGTEGFISHIELEKMCFAQI